MRKRAALIECQRNPGIVLKKQVDQQLRYGLPRISLRSIWATFSLIAREIDWQRIESRRRKSKSGTATTAQ